MIKQYAITPDAFEAGVLKEMFPPGVVLLQLLRGICNHGLLANLHGADWMREVVRQKRDPSMPPDVWSKVESCLNQLYDMNRLVIHPKTHEVDGDVDFQWLKRARDCQTASTEPCFDVVFASDVVLGCSDIHEETFVALSQALDCPQWESRKQSGTLLKTESALRQVLKPFLRYARQVVLIDPYMTCRLDRFFNTVEHCADLLGKSHGTQVPGRIVIHAGDPAVFGQEDLRESAEERLNRWGEAAQPVVRQWGHSIQVSLWAKKPGGPKVHDRFLITDQCGISIPSGLDFLPDERAASANTTTWNVLDRNVVRETLQHYHHARSPFKYLATRKFGG